MNAAEICMRASRAEVESALGQSSQIKSLRLDGETTRVAFNSDAVANIVDDEQSGYTVSVFVFDPMEEGAAKALYDELVSKFPWAIELRDENTYEMVEKRPGP